MKKLRFFLPIILVFLGLNFPLFAQSLSSSDLYHELLKLEETKRVLYVAAHPDDENTRLIAYLANETKARVAYLSLTRGDGGQNLIGPELGIGLGQIRTQELLQARMTDGGVQYFTRAKDFGYSKNPSETLQNWNKETILSDVVWVIRKFQPDIIITRFNTIPGVTHGHHTTSAILAEEAFAISGDPNAFPEQLEYVKPWSAKRIFWNAYNFRGEFEAQEGEVYHEFPTGDYNPVLGQTYNQMAANSRTMHKSQGFGSTAYIGASNDHIQFIAGEKFEQGPFEGVKNRWDHFENGKATELLINDLIQNFDFRSPANNLSALLKIREQINQMEGSDLWIKEKKESINDIVLKVIGSKIEFVTNQEVAFPGASVSTDLVINSPGNTAINILGVEVLGEKVEVEGGGSSANEPFRQDINLTIPEGFDFTQPYWLENYEDGPMYPVGDQQMIGKPFNDASIQATLNLEIEGQLLTISTPLVYKFNDPVDGEVNQPFIITPSIDLELSKKVLFGINEKRPQVTVFVNFRDKIVDGVLSFAGLDSSEYRILESEDLVGRKQRRYQVEFVSDQVGKRRILATYTTSSGSFDQTLNRITYKHIPNLTFFTSASIDWIQADWEISGGKIGYVPGAGDEVSEVLEALGYEVTMLGDSDFDLDNLAQFKAIIMGIRAYNTNAQAAANQQALMGYVLSGGNMIVQYNTTGRLLTNQLGPYPFSLTRDRVSVETAPVEADYTHPILAGPNKISPNDFEGWVQERGLYFAGSLDEEYSTPLYMNDPGEDTQTGSLIHAAYGKGNYVYTGLSFFRQLPAGVPGAVKLFVNLIEQ